MYKSTEETKCMQHIVFIYLPLFPPKMKLWRLNQFCCGCSLQIGTKLIGILCLVIGFGGFVKDLFDSISNVSNEEVSDNVLQMIGSSLTIASSICVLISAWKNHKPMFLMPWLVIQAISFIAAIGYSLYCGIILSEAREVQFAIGYFIGCFIGAAIWFSFWLVIYSYFLELKEKAKLIKLPPNEKMTDYQIIAITDDPLLECGKNVETVLKLTTVD